MKLWARSLPKKITLKKISINAESKKATVEMQQVYRASDGTGDEGIKTLHFAKIGDTWFIVNEVWRASANEI